MQHKDYITIQKILDETNIAIQLLGETELDAFMNDEMLKRATGMTLINIGELVKNLTDGFRVIHNTIPWKEISGFRDVAAHKYKTLDMKIVYNTVKFDIPELKTNVESILAKEPNVKN